MASLLAPGEGLLVGSFARALFLVHSECAESAYINSRPFRVNAGPVSALLQGILLPEIWRMGSVSGGLRAVDGRAGKHAALASILGRQHKLTSETSAAFSGHLP
jgi:hypothetical protein